ncbi:MAG: hypothetical protein HRT61_19495, partial [Ekhidna sp.]|nr:hypothetical protein [Ekhidna sp.]
MRTALVVVFALFIRSYSSSQVLPADSLESLNRIIQFSSNIDSINQAYLDLLTYYDYQSKDSAIRISRSYVEFADQTNNAEWQVFSRRLLSSFYEDIGYYNLALDVALDGLAISENVELAPKYQVMILQGLGWIYDDLRDDDKTFDYFNQSLRLAENLGDTILIASSYYCLGAA